MLILLVCRASSATAAPGRIELYPATPCAVFEDRLAAMIGGRPMRLERHRNRHPQMRHFMDTARVRLAAEGPVDVELKVLSTAVSRAHLRTVGKDLDFRLATSAGGSTLSLRLPGPGQYYLQLPELAAKDGTYTVLFWIDDLGLRSKTRIRPGDGGAVDAAARGVRSDPGADQTAAIQAVLDGKGTVLFPAGVYRCGPLRIGSDTTVYLAPGAILKARDANDGWGGAFVSIDGARNVRICGPGTIDAGLRGQKMRNVSITSCRNVTLEDVLLEDSISWAVHIHRTDGFTARNVKVFSARDGFDPDSSRDVLLDGVFVVSIDDAVAVKNRSPGEPDGRTTERVTVRNSIVNSTKSALKIGTETRGAIRDVVFENCDVYDGDRGVVLYARDGGPVENAAWRNVRMFLIDWAAEKESGTAFHLTIAHRDGAQAPTPVRNCRIENVTANFLYRSQLGGLSDAPLDGVAMRNITVNVEPPKDGKRHYLFECLPHTAVEVRGLQVNWQGNQDRWAGVSSGPGLKVLPDSAQVP